MTADWLLALGPARAGSRPPKQVAGWLLSLLLIAAFVHLTSPSAATSSVSSPEESEPLSSRNLTTELNQTTTTTTTTITPRHCPACGLNDLNCDNVHQCSGPCGQIKSANYPQNYTNNHRCRWSIRAPNGHYVNLSIIDFDIPSANNATKLGTCIFDYLTLIDGYTGKRIGCYCNENLPPAYIVSPWNELIIQFDTNSETTGRGFNVQYEIMKLRLNERISKQLSNSDEACLMGWKFFRGFCYRAYNDPEPLQWNDAEKRCAHSSKGLDGHLVSILDRDEMLVILYWLTNEWNSTRYREYYIGLIDETREGLYRWSDNNPMSYTDWELKPMLLEDETPAQPDGGAYEDCTVIRYSSFSRTSNWHDVPCSLGKHYHSHLDKGLQIKFKWDYVSSYICKSDSMSFNPTSQKAKVRTQLYSEVFRPSATLLANSVISSTITKPPPPSTGWQAQAAESGLGNSSLLQSNQIQTNQIQAQNQSKAIEQQPLLTQRELFLKLSKLDDNRYFVCDNLEVISIVLRCDGVTQCRDGSDESAGCDQDCLEWQFKCANGRCISIGHYCDFSDDCGDGSDESRCERHRCKLNEFRCQNGQCIPAQQRCDLLPDCNDSSDEGRSCTIGSNCNTNTTFQCYNGLCIPQYAVCDFQIDCPGKFHEDEVGCELLQRNGLGIGGGGSGGGANRNATLVIGNQTGSKQENNHANENSGKSWWQQQEAPIPTDLFRCKSGNLINASHRCLFEFDRYGFQLGCRDVSHLIDCQDFECPQRDYVKCPDSYCIPWRYVCDGKWDCVLGDDETGCARYLCPGQYKCANQSSCILLHQLCDGARQCPMGDDEWFCDLHCPASCDCIGQSVSCQRANLSGLPRDYMPKSVRKLDLSHNKLGPSLANTNFDAYHDLGELILSHNQIEVLTPRKFHQLRNLYKLDLSYNQIHSVKRGAFAGLRRVTQLLLESNQQLFLLEPEAFLGLSSLQMLNISSSRISSLRKNTFDGLTSLRHLLLRSNMILSIEDGAFRSLSSLVSLDMRGNDIKHFTKLVFTDLKSLRNLSTDSFKFCCLVNHQIPADKCLPLPDEISDCEDLLSSVPQRTCIWIAGGFACVGNLIVIIWRYRDRLGQKEREVEHVNSSLLLSLGFSDLLMGIYLIIIALVDSWYRGHYIENADKWRESPLCNLCGFLSTISSTVSVLTLVFIAYNRYLEICRPFKVADKFTLGYTQRLIRFSWLMALTIATLPLVIKPYFRGQFYAKSGVCLAYHITDQKAAGWLYSILVSPCVNLISFIIIFRCYISIYVEISRATRRNEQMDRTVNGGNHQIKIILIILTHFVAFSPPMIIGFMSLAGHTPPAALYSWIAVSVLPVNSAINPMIYTIPNIRHTINMLIINYRARKTATWIRAQSSTGNGSPSTGRSGAASAIPLTSQQPQQQQQLHLQLQQPERPLPLPMLKPDARMRKLLARRNVPPGYLAIRHFIQARDYLRADHLIEIALALALDIESKHRDSKIYASLKLDDVFVSDLLLVESSDRDAANSHQERLAVFLADHDGYRPRRPQPCCQLSREPLRSNSLGLYSSQRPGAPKSNNHQQVASYHSSSNNNNNSHHHHHHHHKHNHRAMLNCECHDVDRFGDILRKLLQLYQNRKVAAARPAEPIANDDTTS